MASEASEIHLAQDEAEPRTLILLKEFKASNTQAAANMARREFNLLRSLSHRGIPHLLDLRIDKGLPFPFYTANPVADLLSVGTFSRTSTRDRLLALIRILDTIAYLHRNMLLLGRDREALGWALSENTTESWPVVLCSPTPISAAQLAGERTPSDKDQPEQTNAESGIAKDLRYFLRIATVIMSADLPAPNTTLKNSTKKWSLSRDQFDHVAEKYGHGACIVLSKIMSGQFSAIPETATHFLAELKRNSPQLHRAQTRGYVPGNDLPLLEREQHFGTIASAIDQLYFSNETEVTTRKALLIVGERGTGKSRLLKDLKAYSQNLGIRFLLIPCAPHGHTAGSPLSSLSTHLALCARDEPLATDEGRPEESSSPSATSTNEHQENQPESPYIEEKPTWVAEQLAARIARATESEPLVIALDDIDQADRSTVQTGLKLLSRANAMPALLLATASLQFYEDALGSPEPASEKTQNLQKLELQPLSSDATRFLLRKVFGESESARESATQLSKISGGLPADATFVLRQLTAREDRERLELLRATARESPALATTTSESVDQKHSFLQFLRTSLSNEELQCAELLAIAADPLELSTLEKSLPESSSAANTASVISALEAAGIVERAYFNSKISFQLASPTFSNFLLMHTDQNNLLTRHAALALALQAESPQRCHTAAIKIAHHFEKAGRRNDAGEWWLAAGKAAFRELSLETAEDSLRKAIEHLSPRPSLLRLAALEKLSEILNISARYNEAEAFLTTLVREASEISATGFLARGLAGLAEVLQGSSEYDKAEALCDRALRLAKETNDPDTEARVLKAVADNLHYQSRLDEAHSCYTRLSNLRSRAGDAFATARALHNLGWVCNSMRKFGEATRHFRRAEAIYRQLDNTPRLTHTLSALGANELDRGNFIAAKGILTETLPMSVDSGAKRTHALVLANLAQARLRLGAHHAAIEDCVQALSIFSELNAPRYLAPSHLTAGWIYTMLGQYQHAEQSLSAARNIYFELNDQPGLALCLSAQSDILRELGDISSAIFWAERATEIARATHDPQTLAISLTSLGRSLAAEDSLQSSSEHLLEARSVARGIGAEDTEHLANLALAECLLRQGKASQSRPLLDAALDRSRRSELQADIPRVHLALAMLHGSTNSTGPCQNHLLEALACSALSAGFDLRLQILLAIEHCTTSGTRSDPLIELELSCALDHMRSQFLHREPVTSLNHRVSELRDIFSIVFSGVRFQLDSPLASRSGNEMLLPPSPPIENEASRAVEPALMDASPPLDGSSFSFLRRDPDFGTLRLCLDRAICGSRSDTGLLFLVNRPSVRLTDPRPKDSSRPEAIQMHLVACRDDSRETVAVPSALNSVEFVTQIVSEIDVATLFQDPIFSFSKSISTTTSAIGCLFLLNPEPHSPAALAALSHIELGLLVLLRLSRSPEYSDGDLRLVSNFGLLTHRLLADRQSPSVYSERIVTKLEDALECDPSYLFAASSDKQAEGQFGSIGLTGHSDLMRKVFQRMRRLGKGSLPVLVQGETGTGKELVARALHEISPVAEGPFVPVDCGALSESLAESELFGHLKGAFSGAESQRQGLLAAASGGTLFLDEIGNLPMPIQLKLLRALETSEVRPVGSDTPRSVDFRLIAATNSNLDSMVAEGTFRADLLHRLQGGRIHLPALRHRSEDLQPLVEHFLEILSSRRGRKMPRLSPSAWDTLRRHSWPGNVRELRLALEAALELNDDDLLQSSDFDLGTACSSGHHSASGHCSHPDRLPRQVASVPIPSTLEGRMLLRALAEKGWDKAAAARSIGWSRQKIYRRLSAHGLPLNVTEEQLEALQGVIEALALASTDPEGPRPAST